jgi:hypothetical protein
VKRIFSEEVGDCRIVIASDGGGFRGVLLRSGKQVDALEGADLGRLKAALRNRAGQLHPDYHGIEGTKARFVRYFPSGFDDPHYLTQERNYKDRSRAALADAAPLELCLEADGDLARGCRKALSTNLLSPFEAARLSELLGSPDGPSFVRAAASFAVEPEQRALKAMEAAIRPHGRASWPLFTYLPFFWRPEEHMFLKPTATTDFAVRVGHPFSRAYDPGPLVEVYSSLLDLVETTRSRISELRPKDRIDVQSFIWVVGSYTDKELPPMS